jgi:hypothetical protein
MIIRIKDGVAMLLDEKESETARKEKSQHYWILVKNGDDSWIIDEDKNKVRPFIRDYISRMPGSLEIKYLTFISAIVSVLFFVCSISWYTNDSEKKIDTLSTNIESAVKRMEETQKIFSKPSALPERITSTGSTNFATPSTTVTNPLSNAS